MNGRETRRSVSVVVRSLDKRSILARWQAAGEEDTRMTYRVVVSSELAKLFSLLSHPNRVRIVEELRGGELSVKELQKRLGTTHASVSQQLAVLRSNRIVVERREWRTVFYQLRDPELAAWVLSGLRFVSPDDQRIKEMVVAIETARQSWA